MSNPKLIDIIIPARNEKSLLVPLVQEIGRYIPAEGFRFTLTLVDDGSDDGTTEEWIRLAEENADPRLTLRLLQLSRNFGKEAALMAGMNRSTGDAAIIMDADLEHPPSLIPAMIDAWGRGFQNVYGVRVDRSNESLHSRASGWLAHRILSTIATIDLPHDAGDFRLLGRSAINAILALPESDRYSKGLFAYVGFRSMAVPFQSQSSPGRVRRYRFRSRLKLFLDGMTGFSDVPLRLVLYFGLMMMAVSLLGLFWIFYQYLFVAKPPPGLATLYVLIIGGTGCQSVAIGIVAEYVARIYRESKRRPNYFIAHEHGFGCAGNSAG